MRRKPVIVVAHNVIRGGGPPIVIDFVNYCLTENQSVIVLCSNGKVYKSLDDIISTDNSCFRKVYRIGGVINFIGFKPIISYIFLPIFCGIFEAEKVFNFGNVAFPSLKPQFLLMHNAFVVNDDPSVYNEMPIRDVFKQKLMNWFIRVNLRFADKIGVQTESIKKRIDAFTNKDSIVIPNFSSSVGVSPSCFRFLSKKIVFKLLFLSKYYAHKNFEVLIPVAKLIVSHKLPIVFTLTLSEDDKWDKAFLDVLAESNLGHVIKNVGSVEYDDLENIYHQHDGVFLPTLMESFSGTYIEAMRFGKPIFTSNRDFAKDICGPHAFYFEPHDPLSIVNTISSTFDDIYKIRDFVDLNQKKLEKMKENLVPMAEKIFASLASEN